MEGGNRDIRKLIPALKSGDQEAFRTLVQQLSEPLVRYAFKVLQNEHDARDVVQDAFIRLYRNRKQLNQGLEFRGYCFRIVRNLGRNRLRDQRLRERRESESSEARAMNKQDKMPSLAADAWEQLEKLPTVLRDVMELRFAFGLSRAEIATALDIPEGTVAQRQRKALIQLREELQVRNSASAPVGTSALSALLTANQPQLEPHTLNWNLEEAIMKSIKRIRARSMGFAATGVIVALIASLGIGAAVYSAAFASSTQPESLATVQSHAPSATAPSNPGVGSRTTGPDAKTTSSRGNESAANAVSSNSPTTEPNESGNSPAVQPRESTPEEINGTDLNPDSPTNEAHALEQTPPQFVSEPRDTAVVGIEYHYDVAATGKPVPAIIAQMLPEWLSFDQGMLHGTPALVHAGTNHQVVFEASNGTETIAVQKFVIAVQSAPAITSTPPTVVTAGSPYTYTAVVTGHPAPKLTLVSSPAWLTLNGSTVSGTPTVGDAGKSTEIKIKASNGINPDAEQAWNIIVKAPPVFTSQPITTIKVGKAYKYQIVVDGYPTPTIKSSRLPKWLVLKGNVLAGTPRLADIGKSKKITLTASNGLKPDAKQSFRIVVQKDPKYVELPWTVDDLKKFLVVGRKWTIKDHDALVVGGAKVYSRTEVEISAIKGDSVTIDSVYFTPTMDINKLVYEKRTDQVKTTWQTWSAKCLITPAGGTVRMLANKKIKIMGKTLDCTVIETTYPVKNGKQVYYSYFSEKYPGIEVRGEYEFQSNNPNIPNGVRRTVQEITKVSK